MIESERDGKHTDLDAAGGMEGGMPSGSAGGPSQAEMEEREKKDAAAAGEKTPGSKVADELGDLGKGSHEQTQGVTKPGGA